MSGAGADWKWSWDEHELDQLRRDATLTLAEKIAWLEQAQRVALGLSPATVLEPPKSKAR